MAVCDNKVVFCVRKLLKNSKPGKAVQVDIPHFKEEDLYAMHTLLFYIEKTKDIRKCRQLFISYVSYKSVSIKTVARWLKDVLEKSGRDTSVFKAHSFRGTALAAAFTRGCSLQQILKTGDWSSARNFKTYYLCPVSNAECTFVDAVFS